MSGPFTEDRRREERDRVVREAAEVLAHFEAYTTEAQTRRWASSNMTGNGVYTWSPGDRLVLMTAATLNQRKREVLYEIEWAGDLRRHREADALVNEIARASRAAAGEVQARALESVQEMGLHHELLDDEDLAFVLSAVAEATDETVRESIASARFERGSAKWHAALDLARSTGGLRSERVVERAR